MKKIAQIIIVLAAVLILPNKFVFAEESGFSVRPILPKEQIDPVPYFHIPMNSNSTKEISVVLKNHQKTPIQVQVDAANGFSNPYGNMNYANEEKTEFSEFLNNNYKVAKLIEYPKRVTLKPGEERVINFKLNVPSSVKEGQILGGIQFQAYIVNDNSSSQNSGEKASFGVKVKHRYTIGVLIELPKKVTSNLEIKKASISSSTSIPQILTEIWNNNPTITKGVAFKYQVFKKGSEKILFEGQKDLFDFAPVTSMIVPVDWAYKNFQPGKYEVKVFLMNKENQKVIKDQINEFKVEKKKVVEYAKNTGDSNGVIPKAILLGNWIYVLVVALVVGLFYLGYKLGKRKGQEKEK